MQGKDGLTTPPASPDLALRYRQFQEKRSMLAVASTPQNDEEESDKGLNLENLLSMARSRARKERRKKRKELERQLAILREGASQSSQDGTFAPSSILPQDVRAEQGGIAAGNMDEIPRSINSIAAKTKVEVEEQNTTESVVGEAVGNENVQPAEPAPANEDGTPPDVAKTSTNNMSLVTPCFMPNSTANPVVFSQATGQLGSKVNGPVSQRRFMHYDDDSGSPWSGVMVTRSRKKAKTPLASATKTNEVSIQDNKSTSVAALDLSSKSPERSAAVLRGQVSRPPGVSVNPPQEGMNRLPSSIGRNHHQQQQQTIQIADRLTDKNEKDSKVGVSMFTTGKGSAVYVSKTSMERASTSFGSLTSSEFEKNSELKSNLTGVEGQLAQAQTMVVETPTVTTSLRKQQNISSIPIKQQSQQPMVDSIFTSGSGKRMKVSSVALEKAARSILPNDSSFVQAEVTAPSLVNIAEDESRAKTMKVRETVFEEEEKPSKANMVDSIFTSGSGRKCKVSAASLEKAQAQIAAIVGSNSNTAVAQSSSSTKALGVQPLQHRIVSATTTTPINASSVDASQSVRLESTATTASSSFGTRPGVGPSTAAKQFVRPRPAAPGSSVLPTSRNSIQQQQQQQQPRNAGDLPVEANYRPGSTSPTRLFAVPRRQPVLDKRPKMQALRVFTSVIRNDPLVSDVAKSVTSSNATFVSFAPSWDRPSGILTRPCLETLHALKNHCVAQVPQTAAKSLTLEWVANHFRWIVLKFAGQERLGFNGKGLRFARVTEEMAKRAIREFVKKEYSCLWHIVGGESSPQRPMVLFLSRIVSMPKATTSSKSECACIVELSDSWYGMECGLDGPLAELVRKGSLLPGQKILVANSTLDTPLSESLAFTPLDLNCNRVLSPSAANQRQPKLMVKSNASKPAPWDSRLGFYVYVQSPVGVPVPWQISKRLSQIKPGGGIVARTDLLVVRKSLLLFREECPDGSVVIRSQQDEEAYAASFEARKMEHVQSLEASFQKTISENDSSMNRDVYQRKLNEFLVQHGASNSNLMRQRKVTSFIRLLVRDAPNRRGKSAGLDGRTCLLTVWRPNEETMSLIQEGRVCVVTGLAVSNNSNASGGSYREHPLQQLRLHAYPSSTKWYRLTLSSETALEGYVPRRFQECVEENSSCDSCLIALRSSPDVIFAIRPVPVQEGDSLTVIAIAPASAKTRLMFQPITGSVFAVRDLAIKNKSVQAHVLNAVALDTTAFLSARAPGSAYPREMRESFGHLLDHLEAARALTLSPAGRTLVERALAKVDLLMKGELVADEDVPSGILEGHPQDTASEQVEDKQNERASDESTPSTVNAYADLGRSVEFLDCERSCGPMEVESIATPHQSRIGVDLDVSAGGFAAPANESLTIANESSSTLMMITPQQPNRTVPTTTTFNPFETPRYTPLTEASSSSWSAPPQLPSSTRATTDHLLFASPSNGAVTPSPTQHGQQSVSRGNNGGVMGPPDLMSTSGGSSAVPSSARRPTANNNVRMKLGISAAALSSLQVGRKTIEARLNRGLFSKIQPGWTIRFESGPLFQEVEVVAIRPYASFKMLLEKEPFKRVCPWCETVEQALEEFNAKNGSLDMEHSVLAFEVRCKDAIATPDLVLPRRQPQQVSTNVSTGSSSA